MTKKEIEVWLAEKMAEEIGMPAYEIDPEAPYVQYGVDSAVAVTLSGDLSEWLGRQLAPTLLWDYPTISELASYLASDLQADAQQSAPDVQTMEEQSSDPIAIIGIGCRFPGNADKPEAFWNLLRSGTDAISEVPAERWSLDRYYSEDEESVGTMKTRFGGFVDGIDRMDASFFGLSPREAERMDPQQRLLLEVAHEALEDAGQVVERLAGSKVGVFVGISANDYGHANLTRTDWSEVYAATGNAFSIAANRLSYVFDFQGPSIAFDTACSSSLTAVHVATRSLRDGECDMALVGGVNLLLMPEISVGFSQAGMLSPDGRCKTFDASANGYVRSEGAGVVVLKRLSRALADGDDIYAVISGSAINQDGRSNGLTAPNRLAQEQVLRDAYRSAGVQPHEVQYVEAHGTGTPLGDPIEAGALGAVLGRERGDGVLRVGSVKSNIGHTESAAGIAGLIKVALSLKKGAIPPTLHFHNWNPLIPADELKLAVPQSPEPWHDAERVVAGVSSFGFGGTNVHVVLEQLRTEDSNGHEGASDEEQIEMVTLSAKSEEALGDQVGRLLHYLTEDEAGSAADLARIANTTRLRRSQYDHRLAILAADKQELIRELEGYRNGESSPNVVAGRKKRGGAASQPVFLFCGQGPQWYAMGRELLRTEPVFRQKFEEIDQLIADYQDWSLIDELHKDESESRVHETDFTQALLFALQVSLAALWRSWGIEPAAVIGHSAGEVAAAHVSGALDLANAVRVVYHRGRLIKRTEGKGRPVAVELPKQDVLKYLSGYEDRLDIAASNSPRSCVIAGDEEALQAVVSRMEAEGVFCRFVKMNFASHSRQMEPILSEFSLVLQGMTAQDTSIPMISTVTGDVIEGRKLTAAYWRRNVREMVRFDEAVQRVMAEGRNLFVEIAPHPVLEGSVLDCAAGQEVLVLPSLRRREGERRILLQTLARLYAAGYPMSADALDAAKPWVRLPSYPWQRERFWLDAVQGESERRVEGAGLNEELASWLYDVRWELQERTAPSDAKKQANAPGRWIILADQQGLGEQLARRFEESGDSVVMVRHGESFACLSERSYVVRPGVADDWSQLADYAQEATGLVHLWSLDSTLVADGTLEALQQSQALGVHSLLHVMQTGRSRVWVVTHGANAVGDLQVGQFEQTSLWGLGQTISIEMPQRWGGLIDLDPQTAPVEQAASIVDEIRGSDGEDRVAFRSGQRYAARLTQLSLSDLPSNPWSLQANGTYLITGGLGDLGLLFAKWMAENGARRLILMGRTPMPARTEWANLEPTNRMAERVRVIRELEAMGVSVTLAAVDVTKEAQLNGFLEQYRLEGWPPIRGVIHAGGLVEERALTESTTADLDRIMLPKTEGAWLLHKAFAEEQLDFFVLFSSISVILQSPRLGSYAAGNAFLDGLAAYRRSLGLPALSINWGAWGEVGMVAREDRDASKGASGLKPLPPQDALAVMEQFMRRGVSQVAVMDMVWPEWELLFPQAADVPLIGHLVRASRTGGESARSSERRGRDVLLSLAPAEQAAYVQQHVRELAAETLQQKPDRLDLHVVLNEYGLDSIMAVKIKNRLEQDYGVNLPLQQFVEGVTIAELATQVLQQTEADSGSVGAASAEQSVVDQIPRLPKRDSYELSHAQERMMFVNLFSPSLRLGYLYGIMVEGELNEPAFREAVKSLANRHSIMRTTIVEQDGVMSQFVHDDLFPSYRFEDLTHLDEAKQEAWCMEAARELKPFDLSQESFYRLMLFKLAENRCLLLINAHHIAYDGWSVQIFMNDLLAFYGIHAEGRADEKSPALQYFEFAEWQNNLLRSGGMDEQRAYWRKRLSDDFVPAALPESDPSDLREHDAALDPRAVEVEIADEVADKLRRMSGENRSTLFVTVLTGLKIWMSLVSGQEDVTVGTSLAARSHSDLQEVLGLFINPVALRTDLSGNPSCLEVLERVRNTSYEAYANQDYPYDLVIHDVRGGNANLYTVVFIGHNARDNEWTGGGLHCSIYPVEDWKRGGSRTDGEEEQNTVQAEFDLFDLEISLLENQGRLSLKAAYNKQKFRAAKIQDFLQQLVYVLEQFAEAPETRLRQLHLESFGGTDDLDDLFN